MNDEHKTTDNAQPESGGTVITIRPAHLAVVLLGVVAFGTGLWLAQTVLGEEAPAQAEVASAQAQPPPQPMPAQEQPPIIVQPRRLQETSPGQVLPISASSPMIGEPIVDIEGVTLDGERAKLSDFSGQPVMLNFWATWCPPCTVEMPWMQEVYDEFKDQGFVILAVDAGEKVPAAQVESQVRGFIESRGFTFPVLLPDDPYTPQVEYSVFGLPSTYLISPEGVVVDAHRGMYPNRATMRDRVEKLINDEFR